MELQKLIYVYEKVLEEKNNKISKCFDYFSGYERGFLNGIEHFLKDLKETILEKE